MNNSVVAVLTTNGYRRTRIEHVCMPGETYTRIDSVVKRETTYTNSNDEPTYVTEHGGVIPGKIIIFFQSEHEADIFFLKQELEATNKKLEQERIAHKKAVKTLADIRAALRKIA
jgi:hypothetical protein